MDIDTFLLQFSVFLFNTKTYIAISPLPNEQKIIVLSSLEFSRDIIEKIRIKEGEEEALYYLKEMKNIFK